MKKKTPKKPPSGLIPPRHRVEGQPSWRIASAEVEAFVTQRGGHLAPVIFDRKKRRIMPFGSAPPWSDEQIDASFPPVLRVMRGDFFCMPFGGNEKTFKGERHLPHGETANGLWKLKAFRKLDGESCLHLTMRTSVRAGKVDKFISLRDGHPAVYLRHVVSGMSGPMSLGHHPILRFPNKPGSGLISMSPFKLGQVFIRPTESPANKGYSALLPGATFKTLNKVPTVFGDFADLGRYPARRGYEDIVMMISDPTLPFTWTAVSFPQQRFLWLALKDPRVLRQTLFWISNGGRHYPPWNGRHVNAMGLEETTSYFHTGIAESVAANPIADAGIPTTLLLNRNRPLTVNYIMAAFPIPKKFDRVISVEAEPEKNKIKVRSDSGSTVRIQLDLGFLSQVETSK